MDANFVAAHSVLGLVYVQTGMYEQAGAQFQKVIDIAGDSVEVQVSIKALTGYLYATWGKTSEALKLAQELSSQPAAPPYLIAGIYAALGDKDPAFEWLDRAYRERSFLLVSLKVDPSLDNLRLDPRFQELLSRIGLAVK